MRTKHFIPFYLLMSSFILICCTPRETEEPDARDIFIGSYSFEATGIVDCYSGATKVMSIPLDEKGTFTISKTDINDRVNIVGYNDTIHATVDGNQLILESNTYSINQNGLDMTFSFTYDKATLKQNQLSWDTDVNAKILYNGMTFTGQGQVSMLATKE